MSIRAIIDLGTNSIKTLVLDGADGKTLLDRGTVSRLGEGYLPETGISEAAIRRNLELLQEELRQCKALGAEEILVAGTMILRTAINAGDFLERAQSLTGIRIRIVSEAEEARWSYLAAAGLAMDGDVLVFDLGGGSLELDRGRGENLISARSLPLGAAILTEAHKSSDLITDADFTALNNEIDASLSRYLQPEEEITVIGVGGCVATLACVDLGLKSYDSARIDGYRLSLRGIDQQLDFYRTHPKQEIAALNGMQPGREPIMLAGAMVVSRILHLLKAGSCLVSARGWRHFLIGNELFKNN